MKMKDKMLKFLSELKPYHADFNNLKKDKDFEAYWEDADFLMLFE
jgi:hypothetical protein